VRRVTVRGLFARRLRLALTALAIIVGVMFVAGTLVLGDTLTHTFDSLVGTAYSKINFEIRGRAAFSGNSIEDVNGTNSRNSIPESVTATIAELPGVAYAHASVEGSAQYLDRADNAIGSSGLGFSFDPNKDLSPYRLVAGHAPTADDEVVMDKGTAIKHHFAIGERVLVDVPTGPERFSISGIVTFGSDDNLAGGTLAGFTLTEAQRIFHSSGRVDTISVLTRPHANQIKVENELRRAVPRDAEVITGSQLVSQVSNAVNSELSFISTALLIFAAIALLVGSFTIFNTFSITIGQRTRELALLRVLGASRGQLMRSVLAEAAATGLIASLVGLGLGVLAALGLEAVLRAFGVELPSTPLVFKARTPLIAVAVGVGVTLISSILPARRAVKVPAIAALSDAGGAVVRPPTGRRMLVGTGLGLLGLALVIAGIATPSLGATGLGALLVFVAVTALLPIVAKPVASVIGRPLAGRRRVAGRLGRENAMRNPDRTAQSAAALMVGLMLVSTIAVLGASLSRSANDAVSTAINADYIVSGDGAFSNAVVPSIRKVRGVSAITSAYQGQFEFAGKVTTLTAVTTHDLGRTINLHLISGSLGALSHGQMLVDETTATSDRLHVGSHVKVSFGKTGAGTVTIGGIYKTNPLAGSYFAGAAFFDQHFSDPQPIVVLIRTTAGVENINPRLNRILDPYANVSSKTRAQFEHDERKQIDTLLGLVYVLLALAVLVAVIGIVNTLILSVFERTREIGLLRAVGMSRVQLRRMIRTEAVIVALLGAVVGIIVGTCVGAAVASALRNNNVTAIAVPVPSLIVFLIVAGLLGLVAATWPARRAASLDVLRAISAE
jgi:putative ABC transport system permease protein